MNESQIIERVDFFLKRMAEGNGVVYVGDLYLDLFNENESDPYSEYPVIMERLAAEELAYKTGNGTLMKITDFGRKVVTEGGYNTYKKTQKNEANIRQRFEAMTNEKLIYELLSNKGNTKPVGGHIFYRHSPS